MNSYIQEKLSSGDIKIDPVCWPFCDPLHNYIPATIAVGIIATGAIGGTLIGAYFDCRRKRNSNLNDSMKA